jgi:hypothetical protein
MKPTRAPRVVTRLLREPVGARLQRATRRLTL